ncbi:MAG: hypothetical protein RMA76_34810 [Deltaproteobacteria bacterium]
MAAVEEDILAAGAQIIWVLEHTTTNQDGTAVQCRQAFNGYGSDKGLCVGDGESTPRTRVFDTSPFSEARGIDLIVRRSDMHVVFEAPHGTPSRDTQLTGEELLQEVRNVTGR